MQRLLLLALALLLAAPALAQPDRTVGLFKNAPQAFEGYTLFPPFLGTTTYLIDNEGREVHSWSSAFPPGNSAYLLESGNLLRPANIRALVTTRFTPVGGVAGRVEVLDWDSNVLWSYQLANNQRQFHHDVAALPNGNVLAVAWDYHTPAEAEAAGRRPADIPDGGVWGEVILELQPDGTGGAEVVWEWNVWDHLVQEFDPTKANFGDVSANPRKIDINFAVEGVSDAFPEDWLHVNSIAYNPVDDQIILSSLPFREVWVIDHSTTTAEAATSSGGKYGQGGDLLYRWGNPQAYDRGGPEDQDLFIQHDAEWIPLGLPGQGNLLIFNNGAARMPAFSSVEEVKTPRQPDGSYPLPPPGEPWGPATATRTLTAPNPTSFFAPFISGQQRLPNGNTLVVDGPKGTFLEVGPRARSLAWEYVNPVIAGGTILDYNGAIPPLPIPSAPPGAQANAVFKAERYAPDYPGLVGQDLTPGEPIENYPTVITGAEATLASQALTAGPNPFATETTLRFGLAEAGPVRLTVYDVLGREVARLAEQQMEAGPQSVTFEASGLPAGVYLVRLEAGDRVETRRVTRLQ